MALSRNFRTTYYKTLGVPVVQHIVDVDASFAALLGNDKDKDSDDLPAVNGGNGGVNVLQLVKLALEVGVAPAYRALTWQLLTGALPAIPAAWVFVRQQRQEMYDDLVAAISVLQATTIIKLRPEDDDDDMQDREYAVSANTEEGQNGGIAREEEGRALVRLYRSFWRLVLARDPAQLRGMNDTRYLSAVARAVCEVLSDDAERFWCFDKLLELFDDGLALLDPTLALSSLYRMTTIEMETLLLRVLDVKRRRAAESTHGLKERL